jgi:hypothetical protein
VALPTAGASRFNPDTPLLTDEDVAAFCRDRLLPRWRYRGLQGGATTDVNWPESNCNPGLARAL